MATGHRHYVPAAGRHWRLPFYDLIAKALGADGARAALVEQAAPRPGERLLEIGCGTGSLLLELKRREPDAEVVGLDPDARALAIARGKASREGLQIGLDEGFADALPYPDASFDRVVSCFMFHHLPRAVKEGTLREVRRVLRPGGRLELLDFDGPGGPRTGFLTRRLHRRGMMHDNAEERMVQRMTEAGLRDARLLGRRRGLLRMAYYRAVAP